MNIELENNSAPTLEKFFNDREDIQGIMFDVDNTLVVTDKYFSDITYYLGMDIAEQIEISKSSEVIAQELGNKIGEIYRRNKYHPILMDELCKEALKEYLSIENVSEDIQSVLDYWLKDFYLESPALNEGTVPLLKEIRRCQRKIGLHSHAQDEWTRIKAGVISEGLGESIPYFFTDISLNKDKDRWIQSCEIIDTPIENVLVVGDNLYADIVPAIEAGCKHLIWIDRHDIKIPEEITIPDNVELIIVNRLGEILYSL